MNTHKLHLVIVINILRLKLLYFCNNIVKGCRIKPDLSKWLQQKHFINYNEYQAKTFINY